MGVFSSTKKNELKINKRSQQAAYALNLCMVSVSQIIEYNDLRVMEQEYEAILNNLNLQNFPKDEALLDAIKQILDSITFFKVQATEKELIEQEYQSKVKNAIWKAVPGLGIVPAGNIAAMIISVVAQVGIGYMNYRNEKQQIALEQKRKFWELERAAIEQFNGLRRELFETAWRLSDKYKYDEKSRLTERVISQYNKTLTDPDPLRRYQRLLHLYNQGKFGAYPPILYYIGHAANEVFLDDNLKNQNYFEVAKEYLYKYINCFTNGNELLREDVLLAQACLEYSDLLSLEENKSTTIEYILLAQQKSGNSFDVQQMCAIAFIRNEEYGKAEEILSMLINEGYNQELNAQLLSLVYAKQSTIDGVDVSIKKEQLEKRCPGVLLIEIPNDSKDYDYCYKNFVWRKQKLIYNKYIEEIASFVNEYQIKFSSLWIQQNIDYDSYLEFILQMGDDLRRLTKYSTGKFIEDIKEHIETINSHIANGSELTEEKANEVYINMMRNSIEKAAKELKTNIEKSVEIESFFATIRFEDDIIEYKKYKGNLTRDDNSALVSTNQKRLEELFLGKNSEALQLMRKKTEACVEVLNKPKYNAENLYSNNKEKLLGLVPLHGQKYLRIAFRGDGEFIRYQEKHSEQLEKLGLKGPNSYESIIAIFNSRRISDFDILLTTKGVICLKRHELEERVKYSEMHIGVDDNNKSVLKIGDLIKYEAEDFNLPLFIELCSELGATVSENEINDFSTIIKDIFYKLD